METKRIVSAIIVFAVVISMIIGVGAIIANGDSTDWEDDEANIGPFGAGSDAKWEGTATDGSFEWVTYFTAT